MSGYIIPSQSSHSLLLPTKSNIAVWFRSLSSSCSLFPGCKSLKFFSIQNETLSHWSRSHSFSARLPNLGWLLHVRSRNAFNPLSLLIYAHDGYEKVERAFPLMVGSIYRYDTQSISASYETMCRSKVIMTSCHGISFVANIHDRDRDCPCCLWSTKWTRIVVTAKIRVNELNVYPTRILWDQ